MAQVQKSWEWRMESLFVSGLYSWVTTTLKLSPSKQQQFPISPDPVDGWAAPLLVSQGSLRWPRSLESHWGLGVGVGHGPGSLASPPPGGYTSFPHSLLRAAFRRAMWKLPVHGRPRLQNLRDISFATIYWSRQVMKPARFQGVGKWAPSLGGSSCREFTATFNQPQDRSSFKVIPLLNWWAKRVSQGNGWCSSVEGNWGPVFLPGQEWTRCFQDGPVPTGVGKNPVRESTEQFTWKTAADLTASHIWLHIGILWRVFKNTGVCLGPISQNYNFTGKSVAWGLGIFKSSLGVSNVQPRMPRTGV